MTNAILFWQLVAAALGALWLRAEARLIWGRLRTERPARKRSSPSGASVSCNERTPPPDVRNDDKSDFIAALASFQIKEREAMRRWAATTGPLPSRIRQALQMGAS